MPVTFEAAENVPILTGRSAYPASSASSCSGHTRPCASNGTYTVSAIVSRQLMSLLWCSMRLRNTTGRSCAGTCADRCQRSSSWLGSRMPITWIRRLTAAVEPEPTGSTTSSGPAFR